ncbi:hypothetical protein [Ruegeria sp. HKCCD6604]|uniref:hypothetical protein n=1 Tax=Ruegeria sp. HKCCD6604 TaxID=2683000 RepID=UPI001490C152|nr:hypothetical protein [Ruegeria sp. HKCCD6604]NOC91870.1 hypothetical protein [Ruegeria sp. HKCCD6604]
MHFKNVAAAVAFVFTSSAASVAQEQPMTVERANQLLAVLGQAQQCIGLASTAGDNDENRRIAEVFHTAGRELVTAVRSGQIVVNNFYELPICVGSLMPTDRPRLLADAEEAFQVGLTVGRAVQRCWDDVQDDLKEAVPPPTQMTQETMKKWIDDRSVRAQIWMRERGCALVQLPN